MKRTFTLSGRDRRSITVTIPKGIVSGEKMRLKGKGEPSPYGGGSGDLILVMKVESSRHMVLKDLDITSGLEIYPWEAWFGCEKSVDTLDGKKTVKIPKGIQTGQKIRLKDQGFRDRKGQVGHFYVVVNIVNPSSLSPEQERLYSELAGK